MAAMISLPKEGWLRRCKIGCRRPTAKELVVFVIKKKYYDSYICACCEECFKKKNYCRANGKVRNTIKSTVQFTY